MESLVKAGAFDKMGYSRKGLFLGLEDQLAVTVERRRNEDNGQYSLFAEGNGASKPSGSIPIPAGEWDKRIKLGFEKEMLGLYISDHPLLGIEASLRSQVTCGIPSLQERDDRELVVIGGLVGAITRRFTKNGDPMIFFQLEDLEGDIEVLCFPKTVNAFGPLVQEDAVLLVKGRVDDRGEEVKIVATELVEPRLNGSTTVRIEVPATMLSREKVAALKQVLVNHPGPAEVVLHLTSEKGHKVLRVDGHRVEARSDLFAELRELFGPRAVL
jgi:DNA polymerase-3 subunit alpha